MNFLSLFSGIEAASVALEPIGWRPVAFAEIEPFPCRVLKHHWPHVPNLGDVTRITDEQIAALGPIDVVIGGSPCQDLSIAGARKGLAGTRSSLFHEQMRIFHAARSFCGARWLWWENVPGAFSSAGGADFAVVVGTMAGVAIEPPKRWGKEGACVGPNGLVEWCVLDAQWFGLAQRRKRVFAVLDTGNWASRPPVLLESARLRGDSPPSRKAGQGVAGTLNARTQGGGGLGTDFDLDGRLIPEVCGALTDGAHNGGGSTGRTHTPDELLPALANTLTRRMHKGINTTADEGQTLIPISGGRFDVTAFDCKSSGQAGFGVGEIASTLRSMGHSTSHQNVGGHLAIQRGLQVRRLAPLECERLQGFPDGHTAIPKAKDGPRYKALGNSMAVPVIRWIGQQIARAAA